MTQLTKVVKRNQKIVDFDSQKISNAVKKAFKSANIEDYESQAEYISLCVKNQLQSKDIVTIEEIQNLVEKNLMVSVAKGRTPYKVAKKYILYRDRRDKDRESINKLAQTFHDVVDIEDNNIKKSNANINGNTPAGQMMIFASESSKQHAFDYIVNPKYVQAHKDGYIHIHDADYISTKAANCNQIDLVELFKHNYIYTNDSVMRKPKRISSFASLAAISLQSEQNEMFGGQAVHSWDYAMAKGVALTFKELYKKYNDLLKESTEKVEDSEIKIGSSRIISLTPKTYEIAYKETVKETHEAMAAFIYNLCSMHSRGGGQIVFSSINYGTDDSPEGRIVIEQTLKAVDEGLGDGSTAIFPISVFRVKDGINFTEEDWQLAKSNWNDALSGKLKFKAPNFDLFIRACEVSSRRLFPNFVFEDSTFNQNPLWKQEDPNRYKYEIATMGCRTRVFDNLFGEKSCVSRGNLSFTTINLPRLAIEARLECLETKKEVSNQDVVDIFYNKLNYYMDMAHDQLIERYHFQCSSYAKQFPFIVKNAMLIGTEDMNMDDKMGKALKNGTLSIGFIGLAEALKELTGKHHGEDSEAQKLGLEIITYMRKKTDDMTMKDQLNFSLFATPAEGLSGRFTIIDRKRFGTIPGVTDRDFYTNSNHVPVYYHISAVDKIKIEAPYHELTNAGHIMYIEMDGDPRKNVLAFASVVIEMKRNNIGYGAINHSVDRCCKCGYEGVIDKECPKCHESSLIDRIRRITGYLVGSTDRWNSFKLDELKNRTKHL